MTERERAFASLGFEYAEGIDRASVVKIPATNREARKKANGKWEVQPWNDNYWLVFDDLLDAIKAATPPKTTPALDVGQ
jgi:hypothetical protein